MTVAVGQVWLKADRHFQRFVQITEVKKTQVKYKAVMRNDRKHWVPAFKSREYEISIDHFRGAHKKYALITP